MHRPLTAVALSLVAVLLTAGLAASAIFNPVHAMRVVAQAAGTTTPTGTGTSSPVTTATATGTSLPLAAYPVMPAPIHVHHLHARAKAHAKGPIGVATNKHMGKILVNSRGFTLYYLKAEVSGKIACTGACARVWPPVIVKRGAAISAVHGVTGSVATIHRPDGKTQVTFNGWPMYTFAGDKRPGQTNGQGVHNAWYVATPHLMKR